MTVLYKLTDVNGYTRRGRSDETLWTPGCTVAATGEGGLCSSGVVHAYRYPELGLAMNPMHAAICLPRVWAVKGKVIADDGTKVGCRTVRCLHELEVDHSVLTAAASVRWAIYIASRVGASSAWLAWADAWLSGKDRSARAAAAEAAAAEAAAEAAAAAAAADDPAVWAAEAQALLLQAIGEES